jgi:hypothetical protein
MKIHMKRHLAAARVISSPEGSPFAPDFTSRPRVGDDAGPSRALEVREWSEGQGFPIRINHGAESECDAPAEKLGPGMLPGCPRAALAAALPLSFSGGFQYG